MLEQGSEFPSFLRLNDIPLNVYITFCLSNPLVDGCLDCFHLLAIVKNSAVGVSVQTSELLLSILWGKHLGVELLDHMVIFFFLQFFFFNLFLAGLGLRCCARAFSSCSKWGLLFVAVCGLLIAMASLCCGARALGAQASVVVAHGLSSCGSWALERRLSSCGTRA